MQAASERPLYRYLLWARWRSAGSWPSSATALTCFWHPRQRHGQMPSGWSECLAAVNNAAGKEQGEGEDEEKRKELKGQAPVVASNNSKLNLYMIFTLALWCTKPFKQSLH